MPARRYLVFDDFSGGRNVTDTPLGPDFKSNQVLDALNVDWYKTKGFRKRGGVTSISMTGSGMTDNVWHLARHVPGINEADAELWAFDENSNIYRLDNSATWTAPATIVDAPSATAELKDFTTCTLNGLLFAAYESGNARLHCYDAGTDSWRRTGVYSGLTAPTVADTGAGAYAAVLRYYRVRFVAPATGSTQRVSEPTASVSFTPSGAGTHARITRPTTPANEGITFWRLEASADGVTFYAFSDIAIGTTTFDDNFVVADYDNLLALSPVTGTYTIQKSYKFIAADNNRLLGFGSNNTSDPQNRLEFSAVVGSTGIGDAERVDSSNLYYYDLDEKDGGFATALVGPLWGNFYAFKARQMYEVSPTGSISNPYRITPVSKEIGCVEAHANAIGEDPEGNPCLYFMSARGLYRYGIGGLTYVGLGIEDLVIGPTSTINLSATGVICHMVYHTEKRQLWVWHAVSSDNNPTLLNVLNVVTGGWARYTSSGNLASARCSVMFASSIGASMGRILRPYVGMGSNVVARADDTATTDNSVAYQAYVQTKIIEPGGPGHKGNIGDIQILAPVASGVTITAEVTPDFHAQDQVTGTTLLTAAGAETRVFKRIEGTALSSFSVMTIKVGDGSALDSSWSIDRIVIPVIGQEPATGI